MSKLSNLEFFKLVTANGDAPAAESRFIYPPAIAKTLGNCTVVSADSDLTAVPGLTVENWRSTPT